MSVSGDHLLHEGEMSHTVYIIHQGIVELFKTPSPKSYFATLVGNVTELNLTATVSSSAVGPIPGISLQLFTKLFGSVVRGLLAKLLQIGVPICPRGGLLHNASVFAEDGYIAIATDFSKLASADAMLLLAANLAESAVHHDLAVALSSKS